MSFAVVGFAGTRKVCDVVPLLWMYNHNKHCYWPPKIKTDEELQYLKQNCTVPASNWETHSIRKVFRTYATFAEACKQLETLLEKSSSSEIPLKDDPYVYAYQSESDQADSPEPETKKRKKKHMIKNKKVKSAVNFTITEDADSSCSQITTIISQRDLNHPPSPTTNDRPETPRTPIVERTTKHCWNAVTPTGPLRCFSPSHSQSTISRDEAPVFRTPNIPSNVIVNSLETIRLESLSRKLDILVTSHELLRQRMEQFDTKADQILRLLSNKTVKTLQCPEDFPSFPLQHMRQFKELEKLLDNKNNVSYLKNRLAVIGGGTVRAVTANVMKFLLTNKLARKFNWAGRQQKDSVKPLKSAFSESQMCVVIKEAIFLHFNAGPSSPTDLTEVTVKKAIQDWLRLAPQKYENSKKTPVEVDDI